MRVYIVSKGRAQSLRQHTLALFPDAYVVVPRAEVTTYQDVGVQNVVPQTGQGVSNGRNTALDHGRDHDILMLDDDVKSIGHFTDQKTRVVWQAEVLQQNIGKLFDFTRKHLGIVFSCAPTTNAYFYRPIKPISTNLFLIGTFSGYLAGCRLRYDETLPLKEDYDFTVRVWRECGVALRFNQVFCDALHYTNPGGAVAIRNQVTEAIAIGVLLQRYPDYIKRNSRRANEVLLRLPERRKIRQKVVFL